MARNPGSAWQWSNSACGEGCSPAGLWREEWWGRWVAYCCSHTLLTWGKTGLTRTSVLSDWNTNHVQSVISECCVRLSHQVLCCVYVCAHVCVHVTACMCVCIGMHESEYTWIYMQLWYSGNCYIQCLPHQTHASKIKLKSTMYLNTDTKTSQV